jgi:cellulose synthase/poly-beta-1,6-N-acetylglucosamine synthase-like glycosyltransferase
VTASIFTALAVTCGLLFVYPYAIYALLLRLLPTYVGTAREKRTGEERPLDAALLFCAYNEEAALPSKIENVRLLKAEVPSLRVLAYSDCSSDGTNELLAGARDVLEPVLGEYRVGKVAGLQKLVERTDADILVLTDANVIIEPGSLPRLLEYFEDPEIGCVAGTLVYVEGAAASGSSTARVGGLYWRLEEHIKQLESRSGSTMGADGSFYARRRRGFPRVPSDLVDDMAISFAVLFDGLRCVSAPDARAYETSVADSDEEFRRKRRIGCGSYSTYRFMRGRIAHLQPIDRFKFVSHKLIRWWGAAFLTLSVSFSLAAFASVLTVAMFVVGALVVVLLGRLGAPLIGSLYEIVLAVVATGIGLVESLFGRRYALWTPAKSR